MTRTPMPCVTDDAALPGTDPLARVTATAAAREFLKEIRAEHGEVLFYQSGGCCDGSALMCFPVGDFRIGARDVCLGEIDGTRVWIAGSQYEVWLPTQLILDVVPGLGASFSLDSGRERRFLTRSRLFSPEELVARPGMYPVSD